mmetsp:Transcript_110172/g.292577  ORF Transcript_110172/g.292577 Transcript_110172/m.292577 type:complete len:83 (+) Transcript_110172:370-618(+)
MVVLGGGARQIGLGRWAAKRLSHLDRPCCIYLTGGFAQAGCDTAPRVARLLNGGVLGTVILKSSDSSSWDVLQRHPLGHLIL